jgi:hypothetical protein
MESERIIQEIHTERRSYLEEVEDAVAETEAAATSLDLRLMQLGNRAVEVMADVADRQIRGRVCHVDGEVVTIETIGGARFCFHIERVMAFEFSNIPGETRAVATGHPSTMLAHLREMWTSGARCTVGRMSGPAILGDLQAVTDGHVELIDHQGNDWLIPLQTIAWVGPKL